MFGTYRIVGNRVLLVIFACLLAGKLRTQTSLVSSAILFFSYTRIRIDGLDHTFCAAFDSPVTRLAVVLSVTHTAWLLSYRRKPLSFQILVHCTAQLLCCIAGSGLKKKKGCDLEIQCSTDDKNHFWGGGVGVGGVE